MVTVRRGDVVFVDLNPTSGSEQRGDGRPGLVVQNDMGNEYAPTTIVAPLTTPSEDPSPFEVDVQAKESPLREDSVVDLSQIRVVDVDSQVEETIVSHTEPQMAEVDRAPGSASG
ncbi:MAG: type II toxin-antitoxin system PemK/MazF family toxin [Halodesulfurarchaeum sp.]